MGFGITRGKPLVTGDFGLELNDLPPLDAGPVDPRDWFSAPSQPLEIEIGSGKGTFLLQQARLKPQTNYVGIEWAGEFYRYAADRMRRHRMANVKLLHADAVEFIRYRCAAEVASVLHVYFSDPWPKKRHHKRRVIQDRSLADFHRVLVPRGEVRLVTDHDDLWVWYEEHAARTTLFDRKEFKPSDSAAKGEVVGSNFERKYRVEGRPFYAMTLVKRCTSRERAT